MSEHSNRAASQRGDGPRRRRRRSPASGEAATPEGPRRRRRRSGSPDSDRADESPPRPRRRSEPVHPDPAESGARCVEAEQIDRDALDSDAQRVVVRLQRNGYQAFFVGGCVRDLLIGRVPKDFDVATSAEPTEIRRLFRNGRIIGRRFRLVHVYYGDHIIETSTFRSDPSQASASPRDADIDLDDLLIVEDNEFGTAAEDARRRDFTVNGLFLDPTTNTIYDYVDGLSDLEAGLLRTIGDPFVRLAEDPVRIMRAIKFATRLDFEIERETWKAMCQISPQLSLAAPPRVLEEILRLLRSRTAHGAFRMLGRCGALEVLLPEIDAYLGDSEADTETFWRLLEALDTEVAAGLHPTTSICLATLYLPLFERESDPETRTLPGDPGEPTDVSWEVLEPMATATRLSRRDFSRARRILEVQRRFGQNSSTHKRFSPLLFARSEDFPEAFEVFRMRMQAEGKGSDIVDAWEDRRERAIHATDEELEVERKRIRKRRKRRRRKRKKPDETGRP